MKTIRQLLRQPMRSLFGVVLIAIAVAVLCVCLGQSFAAEETEKRLNETYMTAAFAKGNTDSLQSEWLNSYAAEHPEVVKTVSYAGLASAYIPELTIDNWTQHWHVPLVSSGTMCAPYDTAVLEITLTEIGEVTQMHTYAKDENDKYILDENGVLIALEYPGDNVVINLTGTVERAIALEEDYPDPTGFTARLTLSIPSQTALDELNLTVGERYLVYGTDYVDEDWHLRHSVGGIMSWNKDTELPQWDLDTFRWLDGSNVEYDWTDEQKATLIYDYLDEGFIYTTNPLIFDPVNAEYLYLGLEDTPTYTSSFPVNGFKCKIGDLYHGMELSELNQFRSITMSVNDDGVMPKSRIYQTEDGTWICEMIEERSYIDENGQEIFISQEEYAQRYREPTIAHLTGTAEEFLASEEGALWAEVLRNVEVNNHAFAIFGVDELRYLENFNSGEAKIVQGRDFTDEELENGAKVCIISRQLAQANGLTVGDTIDPQFYDPDLSLGYQLSMSNNTFTPKPLYYFSNTTQLMEVKSYTIVGIYEQNDPTPSLVDTSGNMVNPYGFTSNTIFAPKASIDAAVQYGESWLFKTAVIHNGALEEFQLAAIEAGLGEEFRYDDNGYATVGESLLSYQKGASRATVIGLAVYGIILVLYLAIFPGRLRGQLATMESLGTVRSKRIAHVLLSSLGILIPGTLIGSGVGMLLWEKVVDALTEGSRIMLEVKLSIPTILGIAGAQLLLAAAMVGLLALPMTGRKSLMKRK